VLSFLQWLGKTSLAIRVGNSNRLYNVLDMIHQLAMVVFLGTIVLVSLRLLGLVMRDRRVSEVARDVRYGTMAGLATMLVTGPLLFVPEPVRWYVNDFFRWKMTFLFLALVFHFTLYRWVTRRDDAGPALCRVAGALALFLWFGVGWAGRVFTIF
jgi:uncharacterized membrane protein